MNNQTFFISKPAFDELCKYVCSQIQPSGSEQTDKEALNFAIYWQICLVLEKKVEFINGLHSKIPYYQKLLQNIIDNQMAEWFDVSEIIEKNISESLQNQYSKFNNILDQQKDNSEIWIENFAFL